MTHHDQQDENVPVVTRDGKAMSDTAPTRNKTIVFFAVISLIALAATQYGLTSYLDFATQSRRQANLSDSQADGALSIVRYQAYDQIGDFARACEIVTQLNESGIPIPSRAVDPNPEVRTLASGCGLTVAPPQTDLPPEEIERRGAAALQFLVNARLQAGQAENGALCATVRELLALGVAVPFETVDVRAQVSARASQCAAGQNPPLRAGRTPIAEAVTRVVASVSNRNSIAVISPQRSATSEQGTPWMRLAEAPSWYPAAHAPAPTTH